MKWYGFFCDFFIQTALCTPRSVANRLESDGKTLGVGPNCTQHVANLSFSDASAPEGLVLVMAEG